MKCSQIALSAKHVRQLWFQPGGKGLKNVLGCSSNTFGYENKQHSIFWGPKLKGGQVCTL